MKILRQEMLPAMPSLNPLPPLISLIVSVAFKYVCIYSHSPHRLRFEKPSKS
jgi:hypothetical protein